MIFRLNDLPDIADNAIGVYGLSPAQGTGFVARKGETVEWEMDMKAINFPSSVLPGSFQVNMLKFLHKGENSIRAWVTSDNWGHGSPVSIQLRVKLK